jgi:O-antigen ligase
MLSPEPRTNRSQSIMFTVIGWAPLVIAAGMFWFLEMRAIALGIVGIGYLVHSILCPRVSIYFVIAAIYANFVIGSGIQGFQFAKLFAIWAVVVSTPLLLRTLTGHIDRTARWVIAFVVLTVLAIPMSPNPIVSAKSEISIVSNYGLVLLLCLHLRDRQTFKATLITVFLISGLMGAYFILFGSAGEQGSGARVGLGSMVGEAEFALNMFARLLAVGVMTSIYLFWISKGFFRRALCVGLGVVMCLAIVVTKSRSCYLFVPIALALAVLFTKRIKVHWRVAILITIGVLLVTVFVLGGHLTGGTATERFTSIWEKQNIRPILWKGYFAMSASRGFLPYGFHGVYMHPKAFEHGISHVAHSDYIEILGDFGAIGLFLFLGIHVSLALRLRKIEDFPLQFYLLSVWLFMLLAATTGTNFNTNYYVMALGIVMAGMYLYEREAVQASYLYSQYLEHYYPQGAMAPNLS